MKNTNNRIVGIIYVLLGASFWGIGGTAAHYLFETAHINVNWYVSTRLVLSGILLLGMQLLLSGRETVFAVWKDPKKVYR